MREAVSLMKFPAIVHRMEGATSQEIVNGKLYQDVAQLVSLTLLILEMSQK